MVIKQISPNRNKGLRLYTSTQYPQNGRISKSAIAYEDKTIPICEASTFNSSDKKIGIIGINKLNEQATKKFAIQAIIKFLFQIFSFVLIPLAKVQNIRIEEVKSL